MPSIEILIAFFVATAMFAYMPGPAMLYAAAQTVARGRRSGSMAAVGLHVGGYAHVLAAAAGLAALFHAVPILYIAVKILGAAYLVWLGIRMIRRRPETRSPLPVLQAKSGWRAFSESVTVEVLNPKTAIFFLAFLPQFVDPAASLPVWAQLLALGTFVNLMFSSADITCVALAGAMVDRLRRSSRAQRIMQRVGGGVLIGLGAQLALQRS
jgi:threonine/homoserine/homoserine lactone efflux protein